MISRNLTPDNLWTPYLSNPLPYRPDPSQIVSVRCRRLVSAVPGQPAIEDGCLVYNSGKILAVGRYADLKQKAGPTEDLGEVTLTPGLVNAHCHLKLAKLSRKTTAGQGFMPWLRSLIANDYQTMDSSAVKNAILAAKENGTCAFGDILNTDDLAIAGLLREAGLFYTLFCEAFGYYDCTYKDQGVQFETGTKGNLSGAGHALHTTGPDLLVSVKKESQKRHLPFSIHLAEHDQETGMLMGEKNEFFNLLDEKQMIPQGHQFPMMSPVAYADKLGLLDRQTLAVHCVHVSDADIGILADTRSHVCLCPRSNDFIRVGRSPWEKLIDAGISLSLATDSLASNHDLNLFNELAYFLEHLKRELTLEDAIGLITRNPAKALGLDDRIGTLESGKASCYAVLPDLPDCFKR